MNMELFSPDKILIVVQ